METADSNSHCISYHW